MMNAECRIEYKAHRNAQDDAAEEFLKCSEPLVDG
jgi:hypothetical protein